MHGRIAIRSGVLTIGRHIMTARVASYDFDGKRLEGGFAYGPTAGAGRTSIAGLVVDEDKRLWVADGVTGVLRTFTVFGIEGPSLGPFPSAHPDGRVADKLPSALALEEDEERQLFWIAEASANRHAVQAFNASGERVGSLRSQGDPERSFQDVRDLCLGHGRMAVCEGRRGEVQIFRGREFHYSLRLKAGGEANAAWLLQDGSTLVAQGGRESALIYFDAGGRARQHLASHGIESGQVFEPTSIAVEENAQDGQRRLAVLDRDAERVQVMTLDGICYGEITELP